MNAILPIQAGEQEEPWTFVIVGDLGSDGIACVHKQRRKGDSRTPLTPQEGLR